MGSQSDPRLLVVSPLPELVKGDPRSAFRTEFRDTGDVADRLSLADGFDALVLSVDVRMDASRIAELPSTVRAIATYSVGLDHIDLSAAAQRNLAIFNTPGVLADAVAEVALFLLLGAARRATESIGLIRGGCWSGWTATQLIGVGLTGRTLGILGMGAIGRQVAVRARGFGMEVLYYDPRPAEDELVLARRIWTPLQLVRESDALILACPSTPEARHFVNTGTLDEARPGLILVNIARGDLVVDEDLVAALKDGRVASAGLDVFAGEPKLDPRYLQLPNVFATPHIGSSTGEARRAMGQLLVSALECWGSGHPRNQVQVG